MTLRAGEKIREGNFIKKSERNATPSNDNDKVFRAESDGFMDGQAIRKKISGVVVKGVNGSTTPKAYARLGQNFFPARNTLRGTFRGFSKADLSAAANVPGYLSGAAAVFPNGATSFSLTANAGNNRALVVYLWHYAGFTTPTSMAWNGFTLTKIGTTTFTDTGSNTFDVWVAAIGNSGSNQTFNVTLTGGGRAGNNVASYSAMVYSNINQTTPYIDIKTAIGGGTSATAAALSIAAGYGMASICGCGLSAAAVTTAGFTSRQSSGYTVAGDVEGVTGGIIPSMTRTGNGCAVIGVELNAIAGTETADVLITDGIVDGFTGLTKDEDYYIDNTTGDISTTGTGDFVGRALSTTQIYVKEKYGDDFVIQYDGVASFNIPVSSGEQLTVWFKGTDTTGGGTYDLRLNNVMKDQIQDGNESFPQTCAMMFTEQIKTSGLYTVDVATGFAGSFMKFIAQKNS